MKNNSKYWIIVLCCCGLAASSIGSVTNTVGVFYAPVSQGLGIMRGTFALSATFMTLATAFISLVMPKVLSDLKLKSVIIIGSLLTFGATILMSMCQNVYLFYVLGVVKGIGAGFYGIIPITMIINHWFVKKHGMATSIVLSFSGVAGAVLSPILTSLISSIGWQQTYIVLAFIGLILTLPAIFYPFKFYPSQEGKSAYGANEVQEELHQQEKKKTSFHALSVMFITYLIMTVLLTAITGMPSHLPGYGESVVNASTGALMLSACMIGNIVSKLVIGVISDLLGVIKSVLVMIVMNIVATLMLLLLPNELTLILASFLFGSIYSICAVGIALMTKYFFGEENYPKAYSIINFATNFGAAFAMTLIGFIFDIFHSYSYAFMIAIAFQVLNIVILIFLNMNHNKKDGIM